jgi:starch-binding outer membrane protein, SusD/RagB family
MKINGIILITLLLSLNSCTDFLEAKPDKSLAIPSDKLQYLRLLAENNTVMNEYGPAASDVASDDIYIPETLWPALLQQQPSSANAYIWDKDIFNESDRTDWANPYVMVFYSNLILDGLGKLKEEESSNQWQELKGSALFYRSYAFFNLLQTFSKAYHVNTAGTDLGIVLKLSTDINEKLPRSSVKESYDRILADLQEAIPLLPDEPAYKTRPGRAAAMALLASIYLVQQEYEKALYFSEQVIAKKPGLMDFNNLNAKVNYPVARDNPEVIFSSTMLGLSGMNATYGRVSPELYELYHDNDLRKQVFFKVQSDGSVFKGSYNGNSVKFNGLATDELYLISAECFARLDDPVLAAERLNTLLEKRWKTGTYVPISQKTSTEILKMALDERRKELCFRGKRWTDLKRLNLDPAYQKTLVRTVNGKTYTLPPGDKRYAFPIPSKVVQLSGIAQN